MYYLGPEARLVLTEVHRFGTFMRINTSFTASIRMKSDT